MNHFTKIPAASSNDSSFKQHYGTDLKIENRAVSGDFFASAALRRCRFCWHNVDWKLLNGLKPKSDNKIVLIVKSSLVTNSNRNKSNVWNSFGMSNKMWRIQGEVTNLAMNIFKIYQDKSHTSQCDFFVPLLQFPFAPCEFFCGHHTSQAHWAWTRMFSSYEPRTWPWPAT